MNGKLFAPRVLGILTLAVGYAAALQCYECGYGLELDLTRFPRIFGQDKFAFALSKPRVNFDKWCGQKGQGQNASLVECDANCALVRSVDNLSVIAGCAAPSDLRIDVTYSMARINRSEYEMFICNEAKCNENAERARQVVNRKPGRVASSASGVGLSSAVALLSLALLIRHHF